MKGIELVEYQTKYAAGVAAMWNESGDCWGGYNVRISAEQVIQQEADSDHLIVFLALLNDRVVGYCSLSEYKDDEGALYIDLLNVIPAYHGKKIGKALVLKCVKKTKEMGWPRVDLYTWSGNTKAVPLYKKCGFFWEDDDQSTHLMNFMPALLNSELFSDYFSKVDWYQNSVRKIENVPDGIKLNKFEFYRYNWNNSAGNLEVDICRRSRMICRIETDEYELKALCPKVELVFGRSYKIRYLLVNKADKSIEFEIMGRNNKNIKFDFKDKKTVEKRYEFEAEFFVAPIDRHQIKSRTHPAIWADIKINGKSSKIGIGIYPQFPLELNLKTQKEHLIRQGEEFPVYLDLKNNLDDYAGFSFKLPKNEQIKLRKSEFVIKLNSLEKRSLEIPVALKKAGIFRHKIKIIARMENNNKIEFTQELSEIFRGYNQVIYGETEKAYYIGYDRFLTELDRRDNPNCVSFSSMGSSGGFSISIPKLGKPYSAEFANKSVDRVVYFRENESIVMKLYYSSQRYPNCGFSLYYRLHFNGIMDTWEEIRNLSDTENLTDNYILRSFNFTKPEVVIPYKDKVVELRQEYMFNLDNFSDKNISENWIFIPMQNSNLAVIWSEKDRLKLSDWRFILEHKAKNIEAGGSLIHPIFSFVIGRFNTWKEVRKYAKTKEIKFQNLVEVIELEINKGNPFVGKNFQVALTELRNRNLSGQINVTSKNALFSEKEKQINEIDDNRISLELKLDKKTESDQLNFDFCFCPNEIKRKRIIFPLKETKIVTKNFSCRNCDVLEIDNGLITMKSSPDFSNGIFSLKYGEKEWLDNSFPDRKNKAWWSDWAGGLLARPTRMQFKTLFAEKSKHEFIEIDDNFGNKWQGIRTTITIKRKEDWKGLSWSSYYLLLPGVPVLTFFQIVKQKMDKYLPKFKFETCCFVKSADNLKDSYFKIRNNQDQEARIYAGWEEIWLLGHRTFAFGGKNREKVMQIVLSHHLKQTEVSTDKDTLSFWVEDIFSLKNDQQRYLKPGFCIFNDSFNHVDELHDLFNIEFTFR